MKKHLSSYQKVFRANESAVSYIYTVCWNITYMEENDRSVDLHVITLFHISNGLATFFLFR